MQIPDHGIGLGDHFPSSSNCRRNTPCVDGCDGPMLIDIRSGPKSCAATGVLAPFSGNVYSVGMRDNGRL